jgi:hypothetical protein
MMKGLIPSTFYRSVTMKIRSHAESHIVKLEDGSRWRIFPGDLDATLDWTPDIELAVVAIDGLVLARWPQTQAGSSAFFQSTSSGLPKRPNRSLGTAEEANQLDAFCHRIMARIRGFNYFRPPRKRWPAQLRSPICGGDQQASQTAPSLSCRAPVC